MSGKAILAGLVLVVLAGCTLRPLKNGTDVTAGRNMVADSGMVVSAHPESSAVGVSILRKGGNAVDAAVATEFALAVCYPEAGNIGGGGFMLVRNYDGRTDMIDYREKAPMLSTEEMYLDKEGNPIEGMSTDTHLSSGVPGTVEGMINIHSKYGVLDFRKVIQPAIDLARNGFPVTESQASDLNNNRENFIRKNRSVPVFVKDTPWKAGDTLRQPDLAGTLERIRDLGRDGFYSGVNARLIIKEMHRGNGIISENDLSSYRSVFRNPLSGEYRGYKIITVPPPSGGGIILLQVLGMLKPYDPGKLGFHTARSVHLVAEAEKRAFADRSKFTGDPDFVSVPVEKMIDSEYLKQRMADFTDDKATPSSSVLPGSPVGKESEETTHYSVVDCRGNAVAATTTLNNTFGSSIVVDSAGFLLNDQMDDFSAKPGIPNMFGLTGGKANAIEPGKRMLSSMTPVIIEKDGRLFMVAGSPGGSTIPTSVLQVIINVIDYHMDIGKAVDAGRFHHQWMPDYLTYETNSIDTLTRTALEKMGYVLKKRPAIGRVNAIMVLPDHKLASGADKRGKNAANGY